MHIILRVSYAPADDLQMLPQFTLISFELSFPITLPNVSPTYVFVYFQKIILVILIKNEHHSQTEYAVPVSTMIKTTQLALDADVSRISPEVFQMCKVGLTAV